MDQEEGRSHSSSSDCAIFNTLHSALLLLSHLVDSITMAFNNNNNNNNTGTTGTNEYVPPHPSFPSTQSPADRGQRPARPALWAPRHNPLTPRYAEGTNKPSIGDKISGNVEKLGKSASFTHSRPSPATHDLTSSWTIPNRQSERPPTTPRRSSRDRLRLRDTTSTELLAPTVPTPAPMEPTLAPPAPPARLPAQASRALMSTTVLTSTTATATTRVEASLTS